MSIVLHERYFKVKEAGFELSEFVSKWIAKHGLTWGELTSILANELAYRATYQIRQERHGDDSDKKGDEA